MSEQEKTIEIIPAILTDSEIRFKELVLRMEPYVRRIHLDIADGVFVPNTTIKGSEEVLAVETALKFDIHLMVKNPESVLKDWFYTQADRFIVHAESDGDLSGIIDLIHKNKRQVGICFKPETEFDKFSEIIKKADFVQFMTVHPGFQGGAFVNEVVDKISAFHKEYIDIMIMVDGGITPETAPGLVKAGASVLVSGSYIVKSQDTEKAIKDLQTCTTL